MRSEFIAALTANQGAFGIELSQPEVERLAGYYDLIQEHNPLLHLVAPCSAEEFAVRHILESLTLLEHLPQKVKFADVGAGAGLPSIPCLLVRDDLRGVLIESKEKKAKFLGQAVDQLGIAERSQVVDRQFEETDLAGCEYITCRALDKFTERLPRLLKWARRRKLLLFGGPNLAERLESLGIKADRRLIPFSDQRFLFILPRQK